MTPTPEQLAKLPKWAQEYIGLVERLRERAESELKAYLDSQTPSAIWQEGQREEHRRYIQGREVTFQIPGAKGDITVSTYQNPQRRGPGLFVSGCDFVLAMQSSNTFRIVGVDR